MAAANSYSSPSTAGGNREDLRDILTILAPENTPVISTIGKEGAPKGTYVEWLADALTAPTITGSVEAPASITRNNMASGRARFGNYIHSYHKGYGVTDVQSLVDVAAVGKAGEFDYAKAKAVREAKRDMEAILCSDAEMIQGSNVAAWTTRGLFKWVLAGAQGTNAVPAAFRTPSASILANLDAAALTEEQVNGALQSMFSVYGEKRNYMMVASPGVMAAFDNFTRTQPSATNQRYQVSDRADRHTIDMEVRVFNSSFGKLAIMPSMFLRVDGSGVPDDDAALIINTDLLKLAVLEDLTAVDDTNEQAAGPQGYLKAKFALMCKNPKGLAKFTGDSA